MLARVFSVATHALETFTVEVEVNAGRGRPDICIVGLASKAVKESQERVKTALQNCGIRFPAKRITINLAPADMQKEGPVFDLPIAMGILHAFEYIQLSKHAPVFLGELSLDGQIRKIKGALPSVLHAKQAGFAHIVIPDENVPEINIISGIEIHPIKHITQLIEHFERKASLPSIVPKSFSECTEAPWSVDFADVAGQDTAKRALEIAAAGAHNVLLNGSPGSGKSMLAKAMVSILPPLSEEEAIEVTKIYSIAGLTNEGLVASRPFRSPHHTISDIGLIGGGTQLKPGEISLAHRGVLFMDEFPEFSQSSIECLRQPLEDRLIHLARASGSTTFPAHFTLIAASNPCPCGYALSKKKACSCSEQALERYRRKLSGPILDRIDLHINVQEVETSSLLKHKTSETSALIRQRVIKARQKQRERFRGTAFLFNGELDSKSVKYFCQMTPEANTLLDQAMGTLQLTARSFFKMIKVAQTIADLDDDQIIDIKHIAQALQYRTITG